MHKYNLDESLDLFFDPQINGEKIDGDLNKKILKGLKFYKYYSFEDKYSIDNLRNKCLHLQCVANFNDPFDTDLYVNFPAIDMLIRKMKNYKAARLPSDYLKRRKLVISVIENVRKMIFATCMTDHYDDILMWTHYANNSSGFCIEFSLDKILDKYQTTVLPIKYKKERPNFPLEVFTVLDNNIPGQLRVTKQLFDRYRIKAKCWEYENEYRVFITEELKKDDFIKDIDISCVYLGPMILEENEKLLKELCYKLKIKTRKLKLSEEEYKFY